MLKQNGYNTAWYGKNHNVPDWHTSQAGPFDLWPTGLGFEYFYGFIGGDTNQWAPALFENTKPIEPPHDAKDYFFDKDMADQPSTGSACCTRSRRTSRSWPTTRRARPTRRTTRPRSGSPSSRASSTRAGTSCARRRFARQKELGIVPQDTKLTERSAGIAAWDALDADQKKVYAHMMEVYAAALSLLRPPDGPRPRRDRGNWASWTTRWSSTSRATTAPAPKAARRACSTRCRSSTPSPRTSRTCWRRMDELGGPTTFNHYPVGWAHAMDTPFQWTKQVASHFGGTRNGLVISWPARIKDKGGIRTQFHHVIDIAPTILEAAGVQAPAVLNGVPQKPIEGVSMVYTFDDAKAPSTHRTQYFEMFGNRAIYHDGWVAATTPPLRRGPSARPSTSTTTSGNSTT